MGREERIPRSAYHNMACMHCGGYKFPLLQCSRCDRVTYCDEHCQKADYRNHRQFCRAWRLLRARQPDISRTGEEDYERLLSLVEKRTKWTLDTLEEILGRPLSKTDRQLVITEPRCAICFRTEYDLKQDPKTKGQPLVCCKHCLSVFSCSDEHSGILYETHNVLRYEPGSGATRCKMHRLVVHDDDEEYRHRESGPIWFPDRRVLKYKPLPMFLPGNAWISWLLLPETSWPKDHITLIDMRSISVPLSYPMTILYGIQLFEDPKCRALSENCAGPSALIDSDVPLHARSRLEIHVIGICSSELVAKRAIVFEELQHLLPACKHLILRFVGPDLIEHPSLAAEVPFDFDNMGYDCAECRVGGVVRIESVHPYVYHEWVQERRQANNPNVQWATPDLVVSFNPSMAENPSKKECWAPTISLLLELGVPTLITAFSEKDALMDRDFVVRLGGMMVFRPHKNPWRNEQALPEFSGNDEFYFLNHHVFGFRGRAARQV